MSVVAIVRMSVHQVRTLRTGSSPDREFRAQHPGQTRNSQGTIQCQEVSIFAAANAVSGEEQSDMGYSSAIMRVAACYCQNLITRKLFNRRVFFGVRSKTN